MLCRRFPLPCMRTCRFSSSVPMSYVRVGNFNDSGIPLVIGHGLFGNKHNWQSVSKALNKRLDTPIYLIDWRNHGTSPHTDQHTYELLSDDLTRFIHDVVQKETGQSRINLLGHSMGGKAASYFAVQTSNRPFLNKLIVEDVVPTRGSNFPLFLRYVETLQKLNLNKPRKEILVDLENVVPDLKVRQFLLTNLVSIGPDQFRWKINLVGIGNYLPEILEFKLENGSFDGKTLFLYGEKSEFFETRDKDSIRKFFPNVVFKSVDAGHWIHAEKPDLFVSSVVDFLLGN